MRLGAVFRANARAVLRETGNLASIPREDRSWFHWAWPAWGLRPALTMAAGIMAVVIGYQNLIEIPRLRHETPGASTITVLPEPEVSAVRAATSLTFSRKAGQFLLSVRHEWEESYSGYSCELERRPGSKVLLTGKIGAVSGDFAVLIPTAGLDPGKYVMNVYGVRADGRKVAVTRYPLNLTE